MRFFNGLFMALTTLSSLAYGQVKGLDQVTRSQGWSLKSMATNSRACAHFLRASYYPNRELYEVIFLDPSTGWSDWSEKGFQVGRSTYTVAIGNERMVMTMTEKSLFGTKVVGRQTMQVTQGPAAPSQLEYAELNPQGQVKVRCLYQ